MAEAEDVITDAARHATSFVQALWRRHRSTEPPMPMLALADVAPRLDLLILAVFGQASALRVAQVPARATFLERAFQRQHRPRVTGALPATDGLGIWLPAEAGLPEPAQAMVRFRVAALRQAMRAARGSAVGAGKHATPLERDLYLLIEAAAADADLIRRLPGLQGPLQDQRAAALAARPALRDFPAWRQPLESWVRQGMAAPVSSGGMDRRTSRSPAQSSQMARDMARQFRAHAAMASEADSPQLFKDWWTGELLEQAAAVSLSVDGGNDYTPDDDCAPGPPVRSARLARRPKVRESSDEEDDARQGAWMIQASAPHEVAEDPFGLQRPTDRDAKTAADDFAESLAELDQARLVSTPGRPKEVLLSDDPPPARTKDLARAAAKDTAHIRYPE